MKIKLQSIPITDLDKAQAFYTDVLGFITKHDIPMGDTRYVTLVSPEEPDGTELLLEPNGEHPAVKAFKEAIYSEGLPWTAFLVDDVEAEVERLKERGVSFHAGPTRQGDTVTAVFDDTCGNLIMIYQVDSEG